MYMDYLVAKEIHSFAAQTNNAFTFILKLITIAGNKAIIFFLISFVLVFLKKTRRIGVNLFISITVVSILTVLFKSFINRDRPFINQSSDYYIWWQYTGSLYMDSTSFPSGHSSVSMTLGVTLFLYCKKKYRYLFLLIPIIYGFSRIYFNVHYFTDVCAGYLLGIVTAIPLYFFIHKKGDKVDNILLAENDKFVDKVSEEVINEKVD